MSKTSRNANRDQSVPVGRRFGFYQPKESLARVDVVGYTSNKVEFDLGTPSLERREDITLVGSNLSKDSIYASIKWRPFKGTGSDKFAQLITEFELDLNGNVYFHQQAIVYKPTESKVRPNRIMQYGNSNSNLRLIIYAPYKRTRLLFTGYMRNKAREDDVKFVKTSLIILPTCGIFDFFDEFDESFQSSQFKQQKLSGNFKSTLERFVLHDRHEQMVQIKGDCLVRDETSKTTQTLYFWGLHAREFPNEFPAAIERRSIFVHTTDGRAFNLMRSLDTEASITFQSGYTAFYPKQQTIPLGGKVSVEWQEVVDSSTAEISFEINNQGKSLACCIRPKENKYSRFRPLELGGKAGFAFITRDRLNQENSQSIGNFSEKSLASGRAEFLKKLEEGRIVSEPEGCGGPSLLVVELDQELCGCTSLVGSKAASLSELRHFMIKSPLEYKVPYGIVLTRHAYDMILNQNELIREEAARLEKSLGADVAPEDSQVLADCQRLQSLVIEKGKLPEQLRILVVEKLLLHYENLESLEKTSFAVRSSSWGEDEDDMSAAGQLTTLLGIQGIDKILSGVLACFASKFNYANVQYKRQHGLPLNLPMAVVIQEMVECDKAGVMFTCDPTTGDSGMLLITANFGLGESVVDGKSEPDTIRVRRTEDNELSVQEICIGSKSIIIDSNSLAGRPEQKDYDRAKCCLTEEEILKLANCGLHLIDFYQSNRDIEWGFKGGELHLLQARPVTGLESFTEFELIHEADRQTRAELDFFSRANVGEVMNSALTPMSITHTSHAWNIFTHRFEQKLRPNFKMWPGMSGELIVNSYHTFFSLKGSSMSGLRKSNGELHKFGKAFQLAFFGHDIEDNLDLIEAYKDTAETRNIPLIMFVMTLVTLDLRLMAKRIVMSQRKAIDRVRADLHSKAKCILEGTGSGHEKAWELYELNKVTLEYGSECWRNHGMTIIISNDYNSNLIDVLSKYITDKSVLYSTIGRFFALAGDVISAEIPERIRKISSIIEQQGNSEKFSNFTLEEAKSYLNNHEDNPDLAREYQQFIERFGHRCYNEFDIGTKSWREDPSNIVEIVKQNCSNKNKVANNKPEAAKETFESIISSAGISLSLVDKLRLKYKIVPECQRMISIRELTKDTFVIHTDVMREAARMLSKQMRMNLRIPDEDLFYYLYFDEIEPLLREPQPSIIVHAIRRRNMFRKNFQESWKFEEIIRDHRCIPNHLKPSVELDEKLANAPKLYGTTASCGRVQGRVCLVENYNELSKVRAGDILIAHSTDIAFSPIFPLVAGIITEVGGLISHGAVVAREYGLPSVIGIANITRIIKDGEEIILDADNGVIIRLDQTQATSNGGLDCK